MFVSIPSKVITRTGPVTLGGNGLLDFRRPGTEKAEGGSVGGQRARRAVEQGRGVGDAMGVLRARTDAIVDICHRMP